jgi:hypothetical protein
MISPLVSKVKPLHLPDFAALRDRSVMDAAATARLKALFELTARLRKSQNIRESDRMKTAEEIAKPWAYHWT